MMLRDMLALELDGSAVGQAPHMEIEKLDLNGYYHQ